MSKLQELVDVLNICIESNDRVCKQIANKRQEISDYRKKYLIAKTTGTTLGTIGGIGLILAPFTAGTTLLVSLYAGVGGTISGLGVNLITDAVNSNETKKFIEDLNRFNATRKDHLQRYVLLMEELSENVQAHVKQGVPLEDSIFRGLRDFGGFTEGFNVIMRGLTFATKYSVLEVVLSNAKLVEGFAKFFCIEVPALKLFAVTSKGLNLAKRGLRGVFVTASVVFVLIDVGLLIKDFIRENEATGRAYKIEHQIGEETKQMTSLRLELIKLMQTVNRNKIERSDSSASEDDCICKPIKVSVLYCNIRSANPTTMKVKLAQFKSIVASKRPQIVAIVETWLTAEHSNSKIQSALGLEGYKIFRNDRGNNVYPGLDCKTGEGEKRGGGMLVAWKESPTLTGQQLSFAPEQMSRLITSSNDNLQSYVITCSFNCSSCNRSQTENFSFRVVYRRPAPYDDQSTQDYKELDDFWSSLLLDYYQGSGGFFRGGYRRGVAVGDFNWSNQYGTDIAKGIYKLGFVDIPGETHQRGTSPDMIFDFNGLVERPVTNLGFVSDHAALYFNLKLGKDYSRSKTCDACN